MLKPKSGLSRKINLLKGRVGEYLGEGTLEKPPSGLSYRGMAFMFKMRDLVKPRGKILDELGIREGFKVLDFGCGPGGYVLPAAKLVGGSGKVYALDINPAAVLAVKSLVAKNRLANVETILSDSATGLRAGAIDVVLLYDILHHLKNPDVVLNELRRVLKPDGILSVIDHHLKDEEIILKISGAGLFRLSQRGNVLNFTVVP
jgi:ubiquinone/menaquinone biosynthesis C-methylase UbiE